MRLKLGENIDKIWDLVLKKRGVRESYFFVFFGNHFFVLKTSRNAMQHMISSFKMKGDVIYDHILML